MTPYATRTGATTRAGFTLVELLVVIAIIAVLAAILFPVYSSAREKARRTQCSSNEHQIALAVLMYQQDHDGKFPVKSEIWENLNLPTKVLQCPTAGEYGYVGGGKMASANPITYGYNAWISNKSLASDGMPKADKLIIIADSQETDHQLLTNLDVDYRHGTSAVVAYADGHVATDDTAQIYPVTDHELLGEQVSTWPSGYKALYNAPYPAPYNGQYWTSLSIPPIPGWQSNQFDDPTNMVGPFGAGFAGDQALWVRGFPYLYFTTKPVAEAWLRIPFPANANTITETGMWVVCLPHYDYVNMGASMDVTDPNTPEIRGYAQVNVLDDDLKQIASFKLQLSGTSAEYSINGETLCSLNNVAELTNNIWEENPARGGKTPIQAFNYKYANASRWWGYDWQHAVALIGQGDGKVTCSLVAPNAPEVQADREVDVLPGSDVRKPRWIEFRVSDVGAGHPGEGTIRVITQKYGGGILWGINRE
ncbi:MAG: type II secretion system protein [Armatimonadota bacterium]